MVAHGQRFNATYEGAVTKFRRLYIEQDPRERGGRTRHLVEAFHAENGAVPRLRRHAPVPPGAGVHDRRVLDR